MSQNLIEFGNVLGLQTDLSCIRYSIVVCNCSLPNFPLFISVHSSSASYLQ